MTIDNFINIDHCWLRLRKHRWGTPKRMPDYDYLMPDPFTTPYIHECEECGALKATIHYKENLG